MSECDWKKEEAKKANGRRFAFPQVVCLLPQWRSNVLEIVQCGVCLKLCNRVRSTRATITATVTTSAAVARNGERSSRNLQARSVCVCWILVGRITIITSLSNNNNNKQKIKLKYITRTLAKAPYRAETSTGGDWQRRATFAQLSSPLASHRSSSSVVSAGVFASKHYILLFFDFN